jgi:hypothetical protein
MLFMAVTLHWLAVNPSTGIAACCARAVSGHPAALPISDMNSRRFIMRKSSPAYSAK